MSSATSEETRAAFADERQAQIARVVEERGRARVTELADTFGVSSVTIRKDLDVLADMGRVIRTHGGAIAPRVTGSGPRATMSVTACSNSRRPPSAPSPRPV